MVNRVHKTNYFRKLILGWESDGKDKYKDPEDLAFLQQKEIECREELIARVSTSLKIVSQYIS